MKIGNNRVMVKPALVVLVLALLIAGVSIPLMRNRVVSTEADFGLVNPQRWKFQTSNGGVASLTMQDASAAMKLEPVKGGLYHVDSSDGFTVVIQRIGPTADCVYLRNGFSIDSIRPTGDVHFHFEAQSSDPHAVLFTIRDGQVNNGKLAWSHEYSVKGGAWTSFDDDIPIANLQASGTSNLIMACQLGSSIGSVSLRNITLL